MPIAVTDTVTFIYRDLKASLINPNDLTGAVDTLIKDLAALKLPKPPRSNIRIIRKGVVEFFWETTRDSVLDKLLNGKLGHHAPAVSTEEILPSLLIERIDFRSETQGSNRATRSRKHDVHSILNAKSLSQQPSEQRENSNMYTSQAHHFSERLENRISGPDGTVLTPPSSALTEGTESNPRSANSPAHISKPESHVSSASLPTPINGRPPTEHGHGTRASTSGHAQTPPREQHALPPKPLASSLQESRSRINQLTVELETVRKRLAADLRRECDIIQQLTQLSASRQTHDAPCPPSNNQPSTGGELVLKAQLQIAEQQLKEERRRREAAEDSLKDVQRECREPFVVPALLDAFLTISNLTSEAVLK